MSSARAEEGRGDACDGCLSRGLLLRELAGHIDRAVAAGAGRRARDLLGLGDEELAVALTADRTGSARVLTASRSGAALAQLREELRRERCEAICVHSAAWPGALGLLGSAQPRALFLRGDATLLGGRDGQPLVTIVGSRRASAYGRGVASALGASLGAAGLPIVSGMALGIDAAVHEGAVAAGAGAIAVLGAGPERPYPRSAVSLYRRLAASGLVVSELPPRTPTFRWCFPARNRLMAALGAITVVVESAERSGSLITAEMAADCGRQVGSVPGQVGAWRSAGTNQLIAEGAAVVRGAEDVLDLVFGVGVGAAPRAPTGPPTDVLSAAVLDWLELGNETADQIAVAAALPAADVAAALARLELAGYAERGPAGYRRTALAHPAGRPENTIAR